IHAQNPVFARVQVTTGKIGYQLRWEDIVFQTSGRWYFCPTCQQWSAVNVLDVCPSFRCTGRLEAADPQPRLADNHYRRIYVHPNAGPVPLSAAEHTAQLSPKVATDYQLAFQEGHNKYAAIKQIN